MSSFAHPADYRMKALAYQLAWGSKMAYPAGGEALQLLDMQEEGVKAAPEGPYDASFKLGCQPLGRSITTLACQH